MADFTKKAIRASFLRLLNEKPLKQITVRDIVDDCGINRNTFYYHFQDIPQLVETIIQDEAEQLISEHSSLDSIEECLEAIITFALKNKAAVLHIYRSVNRTIYEQYLWRVCDHVVTDYIDHQLAHRNVSDFDRSTIIKFLKCLSFGLVTDWLENGMKEDVLDFTRRICQMRQGDLEQMIEMCERS